MFTSHRAGGWRALIGAPSGGMGSAWFFERPDQTWLNYAEVDGSYYGTGLSLFGGQRRPLGRRRHRADRQPG
jgi:hypothetical protein